MPKFYLVKDVGPGFDGVLVEGEPVVDITATGIVEILRFIDTDSILGDRNSSSPVTPGSILMDEAFLTEVEDPKLREFDSKNPFGRFELEGRMTCGNLEVAYAQYEKALTVSVIERSESDPTKPVGEQKTLYTETFLEVGAFLNIKLDIESYLKDNETAEDLIFRLKQIKGGQLNG